MVRLQWFLLENVDPRTGQSSRVERLRERPGVDDLAARGVDTYGGRLHQLDLAIAEEVPRLGQERRVKRHEIRLPEEGGVVDENRTHLHRRGSADVWVVGQAMHPEGLGVCRDGAADSAEPNDAEREPFQARDRRNDLGALEPSALAERGI